MWTFTAIPLILVVGVSAVVPHSFAFKTLVLSYNFFFSFSTATQFVEVAHEFLLGR